MTASSGRAFMFDHGSRPLRLELRRLMSESLPDGWLGPFTKDGSDLEISTAFCQKLASQGLLIPEWAPEYGGRGADLSFGIVVREEMWANCEPRGPQYYGPNWVGPSIMHHGTDEQRRVHLPAIAGGTVVWCQGFSEPEAGTDLASLRTRAVPDGDGFRITGQKIWTSWAGWADWCYLLVRVVDDNGPSGITVFLVPMDRPGITVNMIDGIPGPHHLNEVFLDDVWVGRNEVLGEIGAGWNVVRDALSNERVGIARYARSDRVLALLEPRLEPAGPEWDALRRRWIQARVHNRMARLLTQHALQIQRNGGSDDFVVSGARLVTTRGDQEVADLASDVMRDRFFEDRYSADAPEGGLFEFVWRYSQGATIASGTTEALQILLARRLFKGDTVPVSSEAVALVAAVDRVIAPQGGFEAAREAREHPGSRRHLWRAFADVVAGLDPRVDEESSVLAAEVCRRAGFRMTPLPVEALLMCRDREVPVALASETGRLEHADLAETWLVVDLDGAVARHGRGSDPLATRLGTFVADLPAGGTEDGHLSATDPALLLSLSSWYVLGALEAALAMATTYAQQRQQFGAPIGDNQAISFPLADASSELQGLHRLGLFTLWRIHTAPAAALADALALRWATLDSARRILRSCQQVHGAIGLCDEHDLSVVVTGIQPRLRLPLGLEGTATALQSTIAQTGFDSIHTPTEPNR